MSYDRALRLLRETDELNISNGCALIINAAAQPNNIPGICATDAIQLIGNILDTASGDPLMKACWAVSNLTVHDQSREAVYRAGLVPKLNRGLRSGDVETITKAAWAITNLARHPQAQSEIVNSGLLSTLTDLLKSSGDNVRAVVLQPICNIVAHDEYQLLFRRNQGLHPVISLMSSNDERTKELAVTLISFVTTAHDSIREDIVNMGGLRPLCVILTDNNATPRLKELALNSLINLSISEANENTIVEQGVIPSVLQLMTDPSEALKCNSAMLLSNLFTNDTARVRVRNLNWCNPILNAIRNGSIPLVTQLVRVIINITFDEYCRHQLVLANAPNVLEQADSRLNNGQVSGLITSALKNLSVPVSDSTLSAVGSAPPPSTARYVEPSVTPTYNPPTATTSTVSRPTPSKSNDIDDILGDIASMGSSNTSTKTSTPPPKTNTTTTAPPPAKKSNASDALDDILNDISSLTSSPAPRNNSVSNTPPPKTNTTAPKNDYSDIDDILNDMGSAPKKVSVSESVTSRNRPVTQRVSQAFRDDFNDIDALLSGISDDGLDDLLSFNEPTTVDFGDIDDLLGDIGNPSPPKTKSSTNFDDIDDILSDLSMSSSTAPPAKKSNNDLDDIDAFMNDLSKPSTTTRAPAKSTTSADMDAIDDLLAELTF